MLLLIPGIFPVAKPLFRIWPLGFVFYLNVTFISVELRIRWLSEWTSWLEMIIKGLMSFPFRIFGWVRFNFPVLTSDLVARSRIQFSMSMGRLSCGLETTFGIAQTWIESFLKQIIKAQVYHDSWKLTSKCTASFFRRSYSWISLIISYRFAHWWSKVHGLESHL